MRHAWILFVASWQFGGAPERPQPGDGWIGRDKLYHFAGSAVIQSVSHSVLRANGADYAAASGAAAGITLGVGFTKEFVDRAVGKYFSWKDIAADAAGTTAGAVLMRQVDR